MTITAKIICDSTTSAPKYTSTIPNSITLELINYTRKTPYDFDDRLVTVQLRYPRFIHSELMTHRVFSRNASSSRAIPVERLIADVITDTAMPLHWGKNQPGMQAREEHKDFVIIPGIDDELELTNKEAWLVARDNAIEVAKAFAKSGYHKQIVNRLLEPFSHINVIVTSNLWNNFFELRNHEDAQPEIRVLAQEIKSAIDNSTPKFLEPGQWHLPYVVEEDYDYVIELNRSNFGGHDYYQNCYTKLAEMSVARCARVSYFTHEGKKPTIDQDLSLYRKLVKAKPLHASPAEHQAKVVQVPIHNSNFARSRFLQFRKMIEPNIYDFEE